MITLETTATCPMGLAAAVFLEQRGEPYALVVVEDGHFLARHGAPGPRLVRNGESLLGAETIAHLGSSGRIEAHLRERLGPALRRMARGEDARASVRAEVEALERIASEAPVPTPLLAPIGRLFQRGFSPADFPRTVALVREVESSDAFRRATARIAIEDVLRFWFGEPIRNAEDAIARARRWFMGGDAFDAEVRARFMPAIEAALRGDLDGWADTIRGRLALVLVLDQFTRNAFRGDPKTWSGDGRALRLCLEATGEEALSWIERTFLRMPMLHAEDAAMARRSLEHAKRAASDAPIELARLAAAHVEQAEKYADVLSRFGRFPFRNDVLGRATTAEETAFMQTFVRGPPTAMRDQS